MIKLILLPGISVSLSVGQPQLQVRQRSTNFMRRRAKMIAAPALVMFLVLGSFMDRAVAETCTRSASSCMKRYIKDSDFDAASLLYNTEQAFFQNPKQKKKRRKELLALASNLQLVFTPKIAAAVTHIESVTFDPMDPTGWTAVSEAISAASKLIKEWQFHAILSEPEYKLVPSDSLQAKVDTTLQLIEANRRSAFLVFDHSGSDPFFVVYPGPQLSGDARRDTVVHSWEEIRPVILSSDRSGLLQVVQSWADGDATHFSEMYGDEIQRDIADAYYKSVLESALLHDAPNYEGFAESVAAANAVGLNPQAAIASRFLMIISDEPGDLDIGFDLEGVYPFEVTRQDPTAVVLSSHDIVLVLDVESKVLGVRTKETATVQSQYHIGDETTTNPAYIRAQADYSTALNNLSIAGSDYQRAMYEYNANPNFATGYAKGAASNALGAARKALQVAENRLRNTHPTSTKPIYQDYEFSAPTIEVSKHITGAVAMLTSRSDKAQVAPFAINEVKSFRVAVGASPKDAGRAKHYKTPDHLRQFQAEGVSLSVTDIFEHLKSIDASVQYTGEPAEFIGSLTKPNARASEPEVFSSTLHSVAFTQASHPAINAVAVVTSPLGGVGTGFFVSAHTLLTNYHVVQGLDLIEIELFDGRVTTGRVFATDIDRDLALIKSNAPGQPLELYNEPVLPLGERVIAIGHPSGLKFTLTTGVVSGVREQQAVSSSGLGGEFLFVQTDTAISPGNSGGPLLLDGKVIGINTQKVVDVNVEGIGFALHFTEIARFLSASMK